MSLWCFFFQAEDGIRDLVRSRGLGDVYKRQVALLSINNTLHFCQLHIAEPLFGQTRQQLRSGNPCLLYTSDAADERSSVDLGGRRIIKKKITRYRQPQSDTENIIKRSHIIYN